MILMEVIDVVKIRVIDNLFEMPNLSMDKTGLSYGIWLDASGSDRTIEHNLPRLKVIVSRNEYVPVSISDEPKILKSNKELRKFREISKWIKINKEFLLKFWNKEINYEELLNVLKKL
jgi:hypothetical protein